MKASPPWKSFYKDSQIMPIETLEITVRQKEVEDDTKTVITPRLKMDNEIMLSSVFYYYSWFVICFWCYLMNLCESDFFFLFGSTSFNLFVSCCFIRGRLSINLK